MNTYLAVFLGSSDGARRKAWEAMSQAEQRAAEQQGMAAWQAWGETHKDAVVDGGGPLGKTKRASRDGLSDVVNDLAAYVVVRAPSHEAAVKMFEDHPHFSIFPGEAVEVMPVLPIPEG